MKIDQEKVCTHKFCAKDKCTYHPQSQQKVPPQEKVSETKALKEKKEKKEKKDEKK